MERQRVEKGEAKTLKRAIHPFLLALIVQVEKNLETQREREASQYETREPLRAYRTHNQVSQRTFYNRD